MKQNAVYHVVKVKETYIVTGRSIAMHRWSSQTLIVTIHTTRVIFVYLTEIEFLISIESLDIAMSNSASGGFISVSVLKLRHSKWITLRATLMFTQREYDPFRVDDLYTKPITYV